MQTENFQTQFFSRSLHQIFAGKTEEFYSDEFEPAVVKWLRAHGEL